MVSEMSQMNVTANQHIRRDTENGGDWDCDCDSCQQIRSLTGMNKMFDVWPIVRKVRQIEEKLPALPNGPEKRNLQEAHNQLFDKLADLMARK